MRLADYVVDFISKLPHPRVYGIVGAGAMHLNDAICNHPGIKFVAMHHEQAAAMAAEADARITGKIGVVHVTAGPGGTNTLTGIAGAWVDSIPMLVIAGQVTAHTMIGVRSELRQLGTNELDLVSMVKGITKYAVTVFNPRDIRYHLEFALHTATTGRQGPVWIEIPLDVQAADIDPDSLDSMFAPSLGMQTAFVASPAYLEQRVQHVFTALSMAKRPLIFVGNGVRLAGAETQFRAMVAQLGIPVVSSWTGADLMETADSLYIGRPGIMGDRAGNFAVQNADVILAIGTRLSIPQIGHHSHLFAPTAKLIMVDIDPAETTKPTLNVDMAIVADAGAFIKAMLQHEIYVQEWRQVQWAEWSNCCRTWKSRYPVMQPEYRRAGNGLNSYHFMEVMAKLLDDDAIIVTDVGAPFISAFQSLPLRGTQRLIHSGGVSSMGWGIPGAIGACLAGSGRQVVCLVGDGGAMLNLQELQTIAHHKLPIAIFVFCNNGYMTMQYTQATHFKREAASSPQSGMSCPAFIPVADAFGINADLVNSPLTIQMALAGARNRPMVAPVIMPPGQLLIPRVQSRMGEHGKFLPTPIEDMFPYLDRDEFAAQMGMERQAV